MKHKYILLSMALFFFLILFSATSLALIPGDFGSAGNGPPDGVVDFEDLMIFALAYGSTPADANWNPDCDIAGLGSITPDGIIDFEDLMIFALHYGESSVHNLTKDTYYNTIQAALDDADSGNTIEVSLGTYYENIDFNGKNITLRSINPDDSEVVASTVIDGGKNGSVVTFSSGEGAGAVLQGFTITNGSGTEEKLDWICGGGIYVFNSSPTINRNIISKNSVDLVGGGIYMRYSSSNITGNTIIENSAVRCDGGGISMLNSSPTISGNTISGNTASGGGGIDVHLYSSPTISGNNISENSAVVAGGICVGVYSSPTISGNTISGNTAEEVGGGIAMWHSSPTIIGNIINNNSTTIGYSDTGDGGGIYMYNSSPTISGNTITENSAVASGGGICVSSNSYVRTTDGNDWPRNNKPPNEEDTNTYSGNTHGDPPGYTEGADVYFEGSTLPSDETVYRAFLVGVGDYVEDTYDLPEPPYDVDRMNYVLSQCSFGSSNTQFSIISPLKDLSATKSAILQGIASVFSGTDDNDISYFYFSGHGYLDSDTNISYLCPTDTTLVLDLSTMISIDELETALSAIPGTKVVFIGACHSGGFIGKGEEEVIISKEELGSFNEEIINVFSQAQSKGLLTTNQYQVLTSCRSDQMSGGWEDPSVVEGPFGIFDMALCEGAGYFGNYPADTNLDNKVSLNEAYLYVIDWVNDFFEGLPPLDVDLQDVQVYPNDSTFKIIEY